MRNIPTTIGEYLLKKLKSYDINHIFNSLRKSYNLQRINLLLQKVHTKWNLLFRQTV